MNTKVIGQIVEAAGYEVWHRYNDLRKDHRRMKFMQNGYLHTAREYRIWDKKIRAGLRAAGIEYLTAGFEDLKAPWGYGGDSRKYKAYVIRQALPKKTRRARASKK